MFNSTQTSFWSFSSFFCIKIVLHVSNTDLKLKENKDNSHEKKEFYFFMWILFYYKIFYSLLKTENQIKQAIKSKENEIWPNNIYH